MSRFKLGALLHLEGWNAGMLASGSEIILQYWGKRSTESGATKLKWLIFLYNQYSIIPLFHYSIAAAKNSGLL
jgi:hypothetical protein